jgi:hypothetical protein
VCTNRKGVNGSRGCEKEGGLGAEAITDLGAAFTAACAPRTAGLRQDASATQSRRSSGNGVGKTMRPSKAARCKGASPIHLAGPYVQ